MRTFFSHSKLVFLPLLIVINQAAETYTVHCKLTVQALFSMISMCYSRYLLYGGYDFKNPSPDL